MGRKGAAASDKKACKPASKTKIQKPKHATQAAVKSGKTLEWPRVHALLLIEEVHRYDILWNKKSNDCKDSHKNVLAWQEVSESLPFLRTGKECAKKWDGLVNQFRDITRKYVPTGTESDDCEKKSPCYAYEKMDFFRDQIAFRKTRTNTEITVDSSDEEEPAGASETSEVMANSQETSSPAKAVILETPVKAKKIRMEDVALEIQNNTTTLKMTLEGAMSETGTPEQDFGMMIAKRLEYVAKEHRDSAKKHLLSALTHFEFDLDRGLIAPSSQVASQILPNGYLPSL